jgi:uncharacterized membrane protein YfcA
VTILEFCLILWVGALAAGFLGSLTGLGGGVVLVPLLVLLGVDIRYAIGAALVSVIATSSGAAAAYVKEGWTNLRVGMFLELATTFGAVGGALLATTVLPTAAIEIIFGIVLLISSYLALRRRREQVAPEHADRLATWLKLDGSYPTPQGRAPYHVHHVPMGFGLMFLAGILSGLLGIGSGALKVLAMDQAMRMPFKVSTTTSNFMIGVTAAASAGLYLRQGYIDPGLAMPVVLGVLPGAMLGALLLARAKTYWLRVLFCVVLVALGAQMIYNGLSGRV